MSNLPRAQLAPTGGLILAFVPAASVTCWAECRQRDKVKKSIAKYWTSCYFYSNLSLGARSGDRNSISQLEYETHDDFYPFIHTIAFLPFHMQRKKFAHRGWRFDRDARTQSARPRTHRAPSSSFLASDHHQGRTAPISTLSLTALNELPPQHLNHMVQFQYGQKHQRAA
ncbi:hypothetical protein V8C42DRAFT_326799 [Trichoderma barbatum]